MALKTAKAFGILTVILVGSYWSASQFHHGYCAPRGFWGLISTGLTMASPICMAATEIISQAARIYTASWVGVIGGVVACVWEKIKEAGIIDKSK
tara:strand:+ start:1986 stop:2270 length:285 start_codon:yes stop_codon:yes gene_type:complete